MQSIKPDDLTLDDHWILARRGSRNAVDPGRPHAYLLELERQSDGSVDDVAAIFLSNKECPFRCLMCDLWKNTAEERVPDGSIAKQVDWALSQIPPTRHIKLYNSGSFFDKQAIPRADWPALADLLRSYTTVIVEAHPRTIGNDCLEFANVLSGNLQVAMGLETVDQDVLPLLNKRMSLAHFEHAAEFLLSAGIDVRAFVLLRTPFQSEEEGIEWAKRSIEYAFSIGVECCVVIPTRAGNGAMDWLEANGHFNPPSLSSLEHTLDYGVGLQRGRVFVDLWDIDAFFDCMECGPKRADRLRQVNLTQEMFRSVACTACES